MMNDLTISTTLGRLHDKCAREDWHALCAERGINPVAFDDETEVVVACSELERLGIESLRPSM